MENARQWLFGLIPNMEHDTHGNNNFQAMYVNDHPLSNLRAATVERKEYYDEKRRRLIPYETKSKSNRWLIARTYDSFPEWEERLDTSLRNALLRQLVHQRLHPFVTSVGKTAYD